MFDPTSRYARLWTATLRLPDGRDVAYVRRRFAPRADSLPRLADVALGPGERLDLLTARTLGDPTQFWRIADANNALDPLELVERPGRVVHIPQPQP
jgi:hypothetical protein